MVSLMLLSPSLIYHKSKVCANFDHILNILFYYKQTDSSSALVQPNFFSCLLILNAQFPHPSVFCSPLPPESSNFHPSTDLPGNILYIRNIKIFISDTEINTFIHCWIALAITQILFCLLECYGTVQSGTAEFNKSGEELWKSC